MAPGAPPDPDDPERVWRVVSVGGLADLFLIDTRTQRDEQGPDWDQWDGYPADRDALFELHRDPFDPDDPALAVEIVTPSEHGTPKAVRTA